MPWPLSQDYNEAIQSPAQCFADPELRQGEAVTDALGLPAPRSGNFADVYAVVTGQRKWAVKCFTRQIPGLQERYQQISLHLATVKLPFMVDFTFLERGIKVRGDWYPILKMQWVEGLTLNQFVKSNLDKPHLLDVLCQLWVKLATRLREANIAHCDLQHGNVLLVAGEKAGKLSVKLVDYDGMCVPSLTLLKSIEVGHPAYQHPQRQREGIYSLEVDRFSHLVIYTALRALMAGGKPLWEKHDDGDNLLFKPSDFAAPTKSKLFYEMLKSPRADVCKLVRAMVQTVSGPLEKAPLLQEVAPAPAPATKVDVARTHVTAVQGELPAETSENIFASELEGASAARKPQVRKQRSLATPIIAGVVGIALVAGAGLIFLGHGKHPSDEQAKIETAAPNPVPIPSPVVVTTRTEQNGIGQSTKSESERKSAKPVEPPPPPPPLDPVEKPDTPRNDPGATKNDGIESAQAEATVAKKFLRFKNRDHVELANTQGLVNLNGSFTIEMWVRMRPGINQYLAGDESWPQSGAPVRGTAGWVIRADSKEGKANYCEMNLATDQNRWFAVKGEPRVVAMEWRRLAVVKTPSEFRFYVDGRLYTRIDCGGERFVPCPSNIFLGVRKNAWHNRAINADIRAFRVSRKAIYQKEFTPVHDLTKTPDSLLLLDFTGSGDRIADLSGHGHHGMIVGAAWEDLPGNEQKRATVVKRTDPNMPPSPAKANTRLPVPAEAELTMALAKVKEVFKEDYARAHRPSEKDALAARLFKQAKQTKEGPTFQYVILDQVRELAVYAGDAEQAVQAIDEMAKIFLINALEEKTSALEKTVPTTTDSHKAFVTTTLEVIEEAEAVDDYGIAHRLLKVAALSAPKTKSATLQSSFKKHSAEVSVRAKEYEKMKNEIAKLDKDSPAFHLAVGKFDAFLKMEWDKGLPLLALGADPDLADLATKDLKQPRSPAAQVEVGKSWQDYAKKVEEKLAKTAAKRRAYYWYTQALDTLTGQELTDQEEIRVQKYTDKLARDVKDLRGPWDHLDISQAAQAQGLLHLEPGRSITTRRKYKGPIEIAVAVRTEQHSFTIRAFQDILVQFTTAPIKVRTPQGIVEDRIQNRLVASGKSVISNLAPMAPNVIVCRITENGLEVSVNDKGIFSDNRTYNLSSRAPVSISGASSAANVKGFGVRSLR